MLKAKGHLVRGIMVLGNVGPYIVRCQGAIALDILDRDLRIKGHGGT